MYSLSSDNSLLLARHSVYPSKAKHGCHSNYTAVEFISQELLTFILRKLRIPERQPYQISLSQALLPMNSSQRVGMTPRIAHFPPPPLNLSPVLKSLMLVQWGGGLASALAASRVVWHGSFANPWNWTKRRQ